jgi:hypothetical protein
MAAVVISGVRDGTSTTGGARTGKEAVDEGAPSDELVEDAAGGDADADGGGDGARGRDESRSLSGASASSAATSARASTSATQSRSFSVLVVDWPRSSTSDSVPTYCGPDASIRTSTARADRDARRRERYRRRKSSSDGHAFGALNVGGGADCAKARGVSMNATPAARTQEAFGIASRC